MLAAVDLGSNSFRLTVARIVERDNTFQLYTVDRLKETVRLAAGLDDNNYLSKSAIHNAVEVLKRFGERIRNFPPQNVRVVATNTFRIAQNINDILIPAQEALGFPIEIISGQEEARLVYLGVAHELPPSDENRLVVDIGGGSTEFIIGNNLEPKLMKSLTMGCVSFTEKFFPNGNVTAKSFENAQLAARRVVEVISKQYRKMAWVNAYGSSGSAKALVAVSEATGLSEKGITLKALKTMKEIIIKNGSARTDDLLDLKKDRVEVFPAGLAIMLGIFEELKITRMDQGDGALRVGTLYDLLGRQAAADKRVESCKQFMSRYHIDVKQAQRVKELALKLYDDCAEQLPETIDEVRNLLGWACDLHEIGLSISQSSYHRHTAYVLENADMPGFSNSEQKKLALLALAHSGKLSKVELDDESEKMRLAILCIRLATLFLRKRMPLRLNPISLQLKNHKIILRIDAKWLKNNPLTAYSLDLEANEWDKNGYKFEVKPYEEA